MRDPPGTLEKKAESAGRSALSTNQETAPIVTLPSANPRWHIPMLDRNVRSSACERAASGVGEAQGSHSNGRRGSPVTRWRAARPVAPR
jgi:hypothetical protein